MRQLLEQIREYITMCHLDDFWHSGWFVLFAASTIALW